MLGAFAGLLVIWFETSLATARRQLVNATAATDDDIIINGNSVSKTIDVALQDSAADVASKINAVAGETGVSAEPKTKRYFFEYAVDETISVKINKTTGEFVFSSSNVNDVVKINAISGYNRASPLLRLSKSSSSFTSGEWCSH